MPWPAPGRVPPHRAGPVRERTGPTSTYVPTTRTEIGVLGSANLDMRSLFLDYEIAVFAYSQEELEVLTKWFESLLADCAPELERPGRTRALAEDLGRLLAPLM